MKVGYPKMREFANYNENISVAKIFPIKGERVQQFYDVVVKLTGVADSSLPIFPKLNLS